MTRPLPEIARFNPAAHNLAGFRCGVEDVDEFFYPLLDGHNFRFVWEQRVGDILVAAEDGKIIGVVAYAASHLPDKTAETVIGDFRGVGRRKPFEMGRFIPAIRVIILGVAPAHRRRGVGSALIEGVFSAITAPVYFLVPQRGSEVFYESLGFARISGGLRDFMIKIPAPRELPMRPGR